MNQITDRIWLGNSTDAAEPPKQIQAILNCAFDLPNPVQWSRVRLAQCGLVDGPGNPMAAYYSAVAQLAVLSEGGRNTLVHCHDGRSRAAAVVVGYLMATDACQRGWEHWLNFVREKRPTVNPHPAHMAAFVSFDWLLLHAVVRS